MPAIQRKIALAMLTYSHVCSACKVNFSLNSRQNWTFCVCKFIPLNSYRISMTIVQEIFAFGKMLPKNYTAICQNITNICLGNIFQSRQGVNEPAGQDPASEDLRILGDSEKYCRCMEQSEKLCIKIWLRGWRDCRAKNH